MSKEEIIFLLLCLYERKTSEVSVRDIKEYGSNIMNAVVPNILVFPHVDHLQPLMIAKALLSSHICLQTSKASDSF